MRQLKIQPSITYRTDNIDRFLKDIEKRKLITPEEEVTLSERIKNGDKSAEDKLVEANLRFLFSVAKKYQFRGTNLEDLIGDGAEGLIKAAKRFDSSKGFKFISFAVWWVRQSILDGLSKNSRLVRLPGNQLNLLNKYRDAIIVLEQDLQRTPSQEEVMSFMGITQEQYLKLVNAQSKTLSFDVPFEEGETGTLLDVVPDAGEPTDAIVEHDSIRTQIFRAISYLNEKERDVIVMFFGLNNKHPLNLEEIALKMNLTRERVRQIKDSALIKLRRKTAPFLRQSLN